jgi:hypothetical protein
VLAVLAAAALSFAGCGGSAVYDEANAPVLETAALETYNEGTEETQYIRVTLGFDREIAAEKGYTPQIAIAGSAVDKKNIETEASGNELAVTVNSDKIRNGDMVLRLAADSDELAKGITDAGGKSAPKNDGAVEALVPSGVVLTPAGDGAAEVSHVFNIRCIAWIVFTDNGETVGGSLLAGADTLDGAIALHGHEFLKEDAYDVAANLADALAGHFGDRYTFKAEGKTVRAARADGTSGGLAISLYAYTLVV